MAARGTFSSSVHDCSPIASCPSTTNWSTSTDRSFATGEDRGTALPQTNRAGFAIQGTFLSSIRSVARTAASRSMTSPTSRFMGALIFGRFRRRMATVRFHTDDDLRVRGRALRGIGCLRPGFLGRPASVPLSTVSCEVLRSSASGRADTDPRRHCISRRVRPRRRHCSVNSDSTNGRLRCLARRTCSLHPRSAVCGYTAAPSEESVSTSAAAQRLDFLPMLGSELAPRAVKVALGRAYREGERAARAAGILAWASAFTEGPEGVARTRARPHQRTHLLRGARGITSLIFAPR